MDGTLTRSRSTIDPVMDAILAKAGRSHDIVIVSGARLEQIQVQIPAADVYAVLAQNGNDAYEPFGARAWRNELDWQQKRWIYNWIDISLEVVCDQFEFTPWPIPSVEDLVEDRGCQISYSLIGHNRPIEEKIAFDRDGSKRRKILDWMPFKSGETEVRIGGTTCLDFFLIGKHKGTNVKAYADRKGWIPEECLYIGDALFEGGNDFPVVGVMPTLSVNGPDDTFQFLEGIV
jgi:phosphomannomutase